MRAPPATKPLLGALAALLLCALASAEEPDRAVAEQRHETATFSMYCYWTGEATLGRMDGVLASRIGHWGGSEIVQVDYDPQRTDVPALVEALKKQSSFYSVVVPDSGAAAASALPGDPEEIVRRAGAPRFIEPKHSLRTRHPELWQLGLSEAQAMALNSWSYFGGPMPDVLTPEQQSRLSPH